MALLTGGRDAMRGRGECSMTIICVWARWKIIHVRVQGTDVCELPVVPCVWRIARARVTGVWWAVVFVRAMRL